MLWMPRVLVPQGGQYALDAWVLVPQGRQYALGAWVLVPHAGECACTSRWVVC